MTTAEILAAFPRLSALVVGDICLDRWCTYDPSLGEPSRETNIPRIGVTSTEVTPGAGGTVANNLASLGAGKVAVLGAIGEDGFGFELTRALDRRGISTDLLVRSPALQTFTYTKLINAETGAEDCPRVDFVNTAPLDATVERLILDRVLCSIEAYDVILIADQAETNRGGVVTPAVRELVADMAPNFPEKVFLADSRARIELFRHIMIKPNQQEAESACTRLFGRVDFQELRRCVQSAHLMVTHGSRGVLVVEESGETWIPARVVEHPVDICGAGDSFAAGAALTLAVTGSAIEAAKFGNQVASLTIMKKGTGTASPQELIANENAGH